MTIFTKRHTIGNNRWLLSTQKPSLKSTNTCWVVSYSYHIVPWLTFHIYQKCANSTKKFNFPDRYITTLNHHILRRPSFKVFVRAREWEKSIERVHMCKTFKSSNAIYHHQLNGNNMMNNVSSVTFYCNNFLRNTGAASSKRSIYFDK